MIRWLARLRAAARFEVLSWWLILTGRGNDPAPDYPDAAFNAWVSAWNKRQS